MMYFEQKKEAAPKRDSLFFFAQEIQTV